MSVVCMRRREEIDGPVFTGRKQPRGAAEGRSGPGEVTRTVQTALPHPAQKREFDSSVVREVYRMCREAQGKANSEREGKEV